MSVYLNRLAHIFHLFSGRRHFIFQQSGEKEPFIDEILRELPSTTKDLAPHQIQTCYEAIGYMISAQPNKAVQERLIMKLMEMPNAAVSHPRRPSFPIRADDCDDSAVGQPHAASQVECRRPRLTREHQNSLQHPQNQCFCMHKHWNFLPSPNYQNLRRYAQPLPSCFWNH